MKRKQLVLPLLTTLTLAPLIGAAQSTQVGVGMEYSRGSYGSVSDTDILSMPFTAKYQTGPWTFQGTLPYLRVKGPGDVIPKLGQVGAVKGRRKGNAGTPSTAVRTTESGMGDVVGAATYSLPLQGTPGITLDLTGKIKFGTADEDKGLGTGEHDVSFQAEAYKAYTPQLTLFAGLGHAILGDSEAIPLDNVFFGYLGGTYKFDDRFTGGLSVNLREAASAFSKDQFDLTASVIFRVTPNMKLQGYAVKGIADGSPDHALGAHVVWNF
jgi:Putative MetA-pathway of phenol degradation